MFQVQHNISKGSKVFDLGAYSETWAFPCYQIKTLKDLVNPCGLPPFNYCRHCYRLLDRKDNDGLNLNELENTLDCTLPPRSSFEYDDRFCSSKCFCQAHFMFRTVATKSVGDTSNDILNYWNERLKYHTFDKTDASVLITTCMYLDFSIHEEFLSKMYDAKWSTTLVEHISEYWVILYSLLSEGTESSNRLFTDQAFQGIVHCVRQRCYTVQRSRNPISVIIDSLFKSTDSVNEKLAEVLTEFNKKLPGFKDLYEVLVQHGASAELAAWRTISRLSQGLQEDIENDIELRSELNSDLIHTIERMKHPLFLISPYMKFNHSCLPNSYIEMDGNDVHLVALYNIDIGESLSVSYIDNLDSHHLDRGIELKQIFGENFTCDCVRCKIERRYHMSEDIESKDRPYRWFEMKRMGDLSMQSAHFNEAEVYYKTALSMNGPDEREIAEVHHSEAASLLGQGKFLLAHEKWKAAAIKFPHHIEIQSQAAKAKDYNTRIVESYAATDKTISYETLIPFKCFITTSSVISLEDCKRAIQWAEEASLTLPGGWTTSRHYAVPTTDIPVHQIPKLLIWFNHLFFSCLRPLLSKQFGDDFVGTNGCDVYIHDAFIVRYDSTGGQRHLPLHRDESTHSFTIALNSLDEYEGGGTYISELKASFRPNQGDILSFRGGNLLHGGDPVLKGTRYIIVAFCYAETKRRKKRKPIDAHTSSFSFGFQFQQ